MKTTLPYRPSELIRLALADLRVVEQDERYSVNMGWWHWPREGKCHVCLAGAVMAKSLNADPARHFTSPGSYPYAERMKLLALDSFRVGLVKVGLSRIGIKLPDGVPAAVDVVRYDQDRTAWYADMERLAAMLEEAGL